MKKILTAVIILALVGFMAYRLYANKEKNAQEVAIVAQKEAQVAVRAAKVTQENVSDLFTANGTFVAEQDLNVSSETGGQIVKIYVKEGDYVKAGQVLATTKADRTNVQLDNARAVLETAKSDLKRFESAYQTGGVTARQLEQAQLQVKNAQANYNSAAIISGDTSVRSKISGIVSSKEVEEGQTVAASISAPTLFKIAKNIKRMQVEVNVDEADIGQVKVGQRVSFTVDAYPQEEFVGRVTQVRLSPTTSSNVVTYKVIVEAENPDEKLKPGLTATIAIYTNELKDVTIVPAKAINFTPDTDVLMQYYAQKDITAEAPKVQHGRGKNKYVWVVNADGSLAQKTVTIGSNDGINVQVVSGLTVGEKVATSLQGSAPQIAGGDSKSSNSSPFMPKRPTRNNSKAK